MESIPLAIPHGFDDAVEEPREPSLLLPDPANAARRIEEWLVTSLEDGASGAVDDGVPSRGGRRRAVVDEGWSRFRVSQRRGIAVVVLRDRKIVQDHDIREIEAELHALIGAGTNRIVLDFDLVELCSSQFLALLAKLFRSCRDGGGMLKVCALRPELAELFALLGRGSIIPIDPDTATAIAGAWPARPRAPLPIEIVSALRGRVGPAPVVPARAATVRPADPPSPTLAAVRLFVLTGEARGKAIAIRGPKFAIGRDPGCHLRPRSPTVSRFHTVIEWRAGRVFVRDLGGTNGTILDGRMLRKVEAEIGDNARLRIGPLHFLVKVEVAPARPKSIEDLVARWLIEGDGDEAADPCAATLLETPAAPGEAIPVALEPEVLPGLARIAYDIEIARGELKCEVIQDVMVVTVMMPTLFEASAIDTLRATLARLFGQATPRRVVVSLCNVAALSNAAVGVLVAHMLRLEWEGGALRLCHILPPVMAALNTIHLPVLIETFPTLDEAVLTAWR